MKSTAPTEQLKAEHEKILFFLGILQRICAELERKRDINPLYLEQLVEFIKIFVDKFHHGKEEDLLFPAMRKAGGHRESSPIRQLMIDHIKGRSVVRDMNIAAERYKKYDLEGPVQFVKRAKSYVSLLIEHIHKEDETYFPVVENALSEKQKKELLDSFEAFGKTMAHHNEYSSMLQTLQSLERIFPERRQS